MSDTMTPNKGAKHITVVGIGCPPPETDRAMRIGTNVGFVEIHITGEMFLAGSEPVQQAIHVARFQFPEIEELEGFRKLDPIYVSIFDLMKAISMMAEINKKTGDENGP